MALRQEADRSGAIAVKRILGWLMLRTPRQQAARCRAEARRLQREAAEIREEADALRSQALLMEAQAAELERQGVLLTAAS